MMIKLYKIKIKYEIMNISVNKYKKVLIIILR